MGRVNSYMRGDKARTVDMAIFKKYRKWNLLQDKKIN
jgi:hypothetical protein